MWKTESGGGGVSESNVWICSNCDSTNYKDLNPTCYRCGDPLPEPTFTLARVKEIIEGIAVRVENGACKSSCFHEVCKKDKLNAARIRETEV